MSKRQSGRQITRDHIGEEFSDDEEPKQFGVATSQVMSKRKIAMPKRKMAFTAPKVNSGESNLASLFDFKKTTSSAGTGAADSEKPLQLKALNVQFSEKIAKSIQGDPYCDLSSLFEKYKSYHSSIESAKIVEEKPKEEAIKPTPAFTFGAQSKESVEKPKFVFGGISSQPVEDEATEDKSEVSSGEAESDDEKKEIKIEGPSFSLSTKPIVKDSTFTFGADLAKKQAAEKDSDDSESEVEIKGPQFTFTGQVNGGVFQLPKKDAVSPENSELKEEKKPAENETVSAKTTAPFSFGLNTASTTISEPAKIQNPFTFSEPAETAPHTKEADSKPEPVFSFGIKKDEPKEAETAEKPKFSFGITSSSNQTSAPAFSFGNTAKKESDGNNDDTKEKQPQGFSSILLSSAKTDEVKKDSASAPVPATSKPSNGFSFKIHDPAPSASNEEKKSSFSFNFGSKKPEESTSEEKKPAFTFGMTNNAEEKNPEIKPVFTFGNSISSVPSFSFGKPATSSTETNPTATPGAFKFSLPFEQKGTPTPDLGETPAESKSEEKQDSVVNEQSTQDNEEKSDSISTVNGEEDEEILFKQKSKLMVFNPETKGYDSKGVGEMKLLQKKDDKSKIRLLCRSDGMGHILLNTTIVKNFTYSPLSPEKDNFVKVPTVDVDGKLTTFIVQYKQKSDGRLFIKSIQDAKKDM